MRTSAISAIAMEDLHLAMIRAYEMEIQTFRLGRSFFTAACKISDARAYRRIGTGAFREYFGRMADPDNKKKIIA